jgi:CheY-like chemotaxis protein
MRKLERVLGADDDPDVCAVLLASLRLIGGLDVRMTGSGEHLIELALERPPDLVLLDVMMPGTDGPSTLRRMREYPLLHAIPAIFITAKVMPPDLRRVLPSGAIGIISKPFDPLKLGEQVMALWSGSQKPASGTESPIPAQDHAEALSARFLRRAAADVALLRVRIDQACLGDATALKEVEHIGHRIHGSAAMLGFHRVSAIGEAIEQLAAGVVADAEAHGPIAESALVQQIAECIERLATAVNDESLRASGRLSPFHDTGSPVATTPRSERSG